MSCQNCSQSYKDCIHGLTFKSDEAFLTPYIGGAPIEPIDFTPIVQATETDTRLQLDVANKNLVYTGEKAQNGGTPDTITIKSIAELINLPDLGDVEFTFASNGDLFIYDVDTGKWISYTIPEGTIVSSIGVSSDGKVVKQLAAAPLPGSVEVPLGGGIFWTLPTAALPSNFLPMDGREVSRTVYAAYFALVGTTYGPGNNTTTFNIPKMDGRTPVGVSPSETEFNALGKTGGNKYNDLNHGHVVNPHDHYNGTVSTGPDNNNHTHNVASGSGSTITTSGVNNTHGHSYERATGVATPGTNGALSSTTSNMQPYMSMFWALRVQ